MVMVNILCQISDFFTFYSHSSKFVLRYTFSVLIKLNFFFFLEGIIRFAQTIKAYEKQDEEVAALNSRLRSIVMPQMAAPPPEPSST